MGYDKPLPGNNPDTQPFWEACHEHILKFQQCVACGYVRWPPAMICPRCHGTQVTWVTAAGTGSIYSYVVYRETYHPAFEPELPYVVALVQLPEGPRLLTNIVGCAPDDLTCDLPVEVAWDDVTETVSLPKFRLRR